MEADRGMEKHSTSSVKRRRSTNNNQEVSSTAYSFNDHKHKKVDYKHPFAVRDWVIGLDSANFGSVTKDIQDPFSSRKLMLIPFLTRFPSLRGDSVNLKPGKDSFNLNDDTGHDTNPIIIIDSDDDEPNCQRPFQQPEPDVVLKNSTEQFPRTPILVHDEARKTLSIDKISLEQLSGDQNRSNIDGQVSLQKCSGRDAVQGQASIGGGDKPTASEPNVEKDRSIEDDDVDGQSDKSIEDDELEGEDDKTIEVDDVEVENNRSVEVGVVDCENDKGIEDGEVEGEDDDMEIENNKSVEDDDVEVENNHDKGVYVGVDEDESDSQSGSNFDWEADIWKEMSIGLESSKYVYLSSNQNSSEDGQDCDHSYILKDDIGYSSKSIRTYYYEGQKNKSGDTSLDENSGGCILAHAPGSGKTFLLISFIQSFMAKYPDARPLVILPGGILGTWKKEFIRWQVEDLLLLDMYSGKADGRGQQLEVLKKWAKQRSILFLGYQLFSSIVCDNDTSPASALCQDILLTRPSLLILDEGHTPRNKETNMFTSLDKVKTPMKVVLSGTLYQNHVSEVFNSLNLVRLKFLKMEKPKAIKRRIMSMVNFKSKTGKGTDKEFFESVEDTLLEDDNFKRKAAIIEDLRNMTSSVLHYYKGDLLDELLGLVDFSVFLKLTPDQKHKVSELKKAAPKFKVSSDYVHPGLEYLLKNTGSKERNDDQIDKLVEKVDDTEGVKAKFFMNMLSMCESGG
ncbi:hypothetical protein L1987_14797 [Smallanthus sonchifolius]|uniref:Uncharacterized protein n=1 Tax=Smallanthus sonchifolius TaxID=185202 RepID=A0ACB9J5Y6_9ASTR|nr:hypothetical protein L1987_14797 [Smallanthus sonchifolius]